MGKIYNNGIKTATGLFIEANTPADDRYAVEILSDLENLTLKYVGLITYVEEEDRHYKWTGATWSVLSAESPIPNLQSVLEAGSIANYNDEVAILGTGTFSINGANIQMNGPGGSITTFPLVGVNITGNSGGVKIGGSQGGVDITGDAQGVIIKGGMNGITLEGQSGGIIVNPQGDQFRYSDDYSGTYSARSIPDVDFVLRIASTASTGLVAIDEGNGIGWRLRGRDNQYYNNIGRDAIDFTANDQLNSGVSGTASIGAGKNVKISASASAGFGENLYIDGENNYAFGTNLNTPENSKGNLLVGNGMYANGTYSVLIGIGNNGYGFANLTIGQDNTDNNGSRLSLITGLGNYNTNVGNFLGGFANQVYGSYSIVYGSNNSIIGGSCSFITGRNNTTYYSENVAIGNGNVVDGLNGIAIGQNNNIYSFGEIVMGLNAANNSGNPTNFVLTDPLFIVGNGKSSTNRSDAFKILKNGLITAPSVTNTLINSGDGKTLITKEWFQVNIPTTSTASWGGIVGTLSNQTDLQNALNLKANLAGPSFSGTVSIPSATFVLTGGATTNYIRGNGTTGVFANDVRGTVLTGLATASNTAIVATDTILTGLGKAQAQLNAKLNSNNPIITGTLTITGGTTSTYIRGNGSTASFMPDVRNTTLFGLSVNNSAITDGITFMDALGRLQGQIIATRDEGIKLTSGSPQTVNEVWYGTLAQYNALPTTYSFVEYNITSLDSNYGNMTVNPSLGSSFSIAHSLGATPSYVNIMFDNYTSEELRSHMTSVNATNITVTFINTPTESSLKVYWDVKI